MKSKRANQCLTDLFIDWTQFSLAIIAAALATLSKEQGITVIALCCIYEIVLNQKVIRILFLQYVHLHNVILYTFSYTNGALSFPH